MRWNSKLAAIALTVAAVGATASGCEEEVPGLQEGNIGAAQVAASEKRQVAGSNHPTVGRFSLVAIYCFVPGSLSSGAYQPGLPELQAQLSGGHTFRPTRPPPSRLVSYQSFTVSTHLPMCGVPLWYSNASGLAYTS